jgi:glycosyltransferase involved in cell wall biosynthesis
MQEADVLTTHSRQNLYVLQSIMPTIPSQAVLFGVSLDSFPVITHADEDLGAKNKLKVAALGNDRHRDWEVLVRALEDESDVELVIATKHDLAHIVGDAPNVDVRPAENMKQIHELYSWADVVIVPLKHNLHAAGITVILEATASNKPVIASDTGGLRDYFNDHEITYVPAEDSDALKITIARLRRSFGEALGKVRRAQTRLRAAELSTVGFAKRHVDLTLELLERR